MVDLVMEGNEEESLSWTVGDPSCGTGGFLVQFMDAIRRHFTSPDGIHIDEDGGKTYTGDLIEPKRWKHIKSEMFHGFDFDVTMLRIAAMNMMLHEIDTPDINYQDTLSTNFTDRAETKRWATDAFDLLLANPPFKGSLDEEDVHKSLTGKVKTKKTELLFLVLILRMLKLGGRCAVIVPDGVTFGNSKAHKQLRQTLVEENQLEAIIKLPSGVFRPYAGVSTAILIFTKGGETGDVLYFDVKADGKTLDDKRSKLGEDDDWQDLDVLRKLWPKWRSGKGKKKFSDRSSNAFYVPKSEIESCEYDLSITRYKKIDYQQTKFDSPKVIIERLRVLEEEIAFNLKELEAMLG
jgi:type I restriction enzyme M protein